MPAQRDTFRNRTAKFRSRILSTFYTKKYKPRLGISETEKSANARYSAIANKIENSPKQSSLVAQIQQSYKKKLEKDKFKIKRASNRIRTATIKALKQRALATQKATYNDCPICYSAMFPGTTTTLTCNHTFHTRCIREWTKQKKYTCPSCRARILYFSNDEMITYNDYETIVSSIVSKAEKDLEKAEKDLEKATKYLEEANHEYTKALNLLNEASLILSNEEMSDTNQEKIDRAHQEAQEASVKYINYYTTYIAANIRRTAIKEKAKARTFPIWELQLEAETLNLENAKSITTRQNSRYTNR